jgi:hypothetical protein
LVEPIRLDQEVDIAAAFVVIDPRPKQRDTLCGPEGLLGGLLDPLDLLACQSHC